MFLLMIIRIVIGILPICMCVYIKTYASPKIAIATTTKSTPLMNTPFLLSLLHCCFELNCGLNAVCIVDIVDVVAIDTDEDTITKTKNNKSNVLYSYIRDTFSKL